MNVALFISCYVDAFFPEVGIATLELLERLGVEVRYPLDQVIAQQEKFPGAKVVCSVAPEVPGNRLIQSVKLPGELEDVDRGVVRAVFGVAETGSVFLTKADFKVNALGFLSQHLVVLLDMNQIVPNLHHAYRYRGFFDAKYAVLMSGPSATADIEGGLVRGAQGVRTLTVVFSKKSDSGKA